MVNRTCGEEMTGGICDNCGFPLTRMRKKSNNGKKLPSCVIINKGKTKMEGAADLVFHDSIGKGLGKIG